MIRMTRHRSAFDGIKRIMDVVGAAVGLGVLAPVMLGVGIGIRVTMGPPIFFKQERVGRNERVFMLWKFRTLAMAGAHCCGAPRACIGMQTPPERVVGRFARFLRRSGLDELPQLLAVLRGEMSLIGPRPLLVRYIPRYTAEQARRHDVRPGITGLAQVSGRTDLSWEERLALDVHYVDHRSFTLDMKIAWQSIAAISKGKGFNQEGTGTGPEFLGRWTRADRCPATLGPIGVPAGLEARATVRWPA